MITRLLLPIITVFTMIMLLGCQMGAAQSEDATDDKEKTVNLVSISGVTAPVKGATPVTKITETTQYSGTVSWSPDVSGTFIASTVYTATITLKAKKGYTFSKVSANSFKVAGATVTNGAGSGVVTAVFPLSPAIVSPNIGNLMEVTGGTFQMSQYEITRAQFKAIMGADPSNTDKSSGLNDPVQANWYQAIAFCNKLSLKEGLTPVYAVNGITDWANLAYGSIPNGSRSNDWDQTTATSSNSGYRLPTQTEWIFAARGGSATHGYTYAGSNTIGDVAVYGNPSKETGYFTTKKTSPVGSKLPNELGIYDMTGNIWEWCFDIVGTIEYRAIRGGAWDSTEARCEISREAGCWPTEGPDSFGFRIIRP